MCEVRNLKVSRQIILKIEMVTIVDYNLGNLGSIENMIKKLGVDVVISSDPKVIESSDHIILPGVGAFDEGMTRLSNSGLIPVLNNVALLMRKPVLGICLGMQLMAHKSEEGKLSGLGWIDAEVVKFDLKETAFKTPHMGWNYMNAVRENSLFRTSNRDRFYFVHSYHLCCRDVSDVLATSYHGIDFVSCFKRDNIVGIQAHPEKSHKFGLEFLNAFCNS
jgi:glutamine amidotransferase